MLLSLQFPYKTYTFCFCVRRQLQECLIHALSVILSFDLYDNLIFLTRESVFYIHNLYFSLLVLVKRLCKPYRCLCVSIQFLCTICYIFLSSIILFTMHKWLINFSDTKFIVYIGIINIYFIFLNVNIAILWLIQAVKNFLQS